MNHLTIPADVRERVIAAAVDLYEQADRQRFPTVDAVRRLSRADMNTVSGVMKEWRQAQTTQAAPVAVAVPEAVQQANAAAVAALWLNATELANQSLRSAQAGWEKERAEQDDMRAELANSYETQAAEFEATKKQLADSEAKTAELAQQLAAAHQRETDAANRADLAEARIADLGGEFDRVILEIERQRTELAAARAKVEASNAAAEALRAELTTVKARAEAGDQSHQEHRKTAAAEALRTAERMTQAEADRDTARKETSAAREEAAKLAGRLEATLTQTASLMQALAARAAAPAPEVVVKPAAKTTKKS